MPGDSGTNAGRQAQFKQVRGKRANTHKLLASMATSVVPSRCHFWPFCQHEGWWWFSPSLFLGFDRSPFHISTTMIIRFYKSVYISKLMVPMGIVLYYDKRGILNTKSCIGIANQGRFDG